ncbi:MAG: NADH-quinone oxidoreductase subunit N [Candidatus Thorarchaeota archaeon]|jgi:NADH-quinone oxidoreductase subunit N
MQLSDIADFIRAIFAPFNDFLGTLPLSDTMLMSLPAITLVVFAILALVVGMKYNPLGVSVIGLVLSAVEMLVIDASLLNQNQQFVRDSMADFFIFIIIIVGFLVLMSSTLYGGDKGPYNFLLLISFAGAMWVVMAVDLVGLFVSWEVMSTPTYILVALGPGRKAVDGATKYFVMGLLATMLMIFGIALIFGVTGTTTITEVAAAVGVIWAGAATTPNAAYTMMLAVILFIASFGFKVGVFPGWQWVPDAYASADGSVTAYLAGGSKKTGVGALMRILIIGFVVAQTEWMPLIAGVAILTMIIGNVLALAQKDIMRMLAYSSISMMGYLFIGVASALYPDPALMVSNPVQYAYLLDAYTLGVGAALFHAFTHALMKTAAFILVWALSIRLAKRITYDDLAGLSKRAPYAAAAFAILMLSLAGMPLTVGFWSKLILFQSAVFAGLWWLALIGLLNSVFSLGYYLRVMRYTYMVDATDDSVIRLPRIPMLAVALCTFAVFALFFYPWIILDYAFAAVPVP